MYILFCLLSIELNILTSLRASNNLRTLLKFFVTARLERALRDLVQMPSSDEGRERRR